MGRFTLRLPETLHQELETRAEQEGVSLNQYVVYALTRQIAAAYMVQVLPDENVRQQQAGFQKLLATLGQSSLETTKQFLSEREIMEPEEDLDDDLRAAIEAKISVANQRMGNAHQTGETVR